MRQTRLALAVLLLVAVAATTGTAWGRNEKSAKGK
jgi:hypothetical protein